MNSPLKRLTPVFIILLTIFQCALAKEEGEKKQKLYSSSTSFSLLLTSGNAEDLTLGLDTEQNLNLDKNQIQFKGNIIYSESEGAKESEIYYSHLEYKRILSSKAYLTSIGSWERNVLSGYNYRLSLSLGAGYLWMKSEKLEFSSEAAVGWSKENNVDKVKDNSISLSFASLLISSKVKAHVSKTSEFAYHEIFFLNLDDSKDYRLSSLASLSVAISGNLALKMSYQLKYNHQPVAGFKNTDHYFLSSLVINF
jgi:putative salt-induced outer membrane protein